MEKKNEDDMKDVFISDYEIITPFGLGSKLAFEKIISGETAIKKHENPKLSAKSFYAAIIEENEDWKKEINSKENYTRLESLILICLQNLLKNSELKFSEKTIFVLSSTKGNVSILENPDAEFPNERAYLTSLTQQIETYFGLNKKLHIVSNACISGSLSIEYARRLLQLDAFDHAIIIGADEVSKFILSGFESFQAISPSICKPFDAKRDGINLGEAIAAVYLTKKATENSVKISGCGTYNDANHISGPSRTGEGLFKSIEKALEISGCEPDFISAHGTATIYNDEMESIAFTRSGLNKILVNSLKGYFGHTLGASGLLETILSIESLKNNQLIASFGFEKQGTSFPLSILQTAEKRNLNSFLKTASGFGGSNIATIFEKV